MAGLDLTSRMIVQNLGVMKNLDVWDHTKEVRVNVEFATASWTFSPFL